MPDRESSRVVFGCSEVLVERGERWHSLLPALLSWDGSFIHSFIRALVSVPLCVVRQRAAAAVLGELEGRCDRDRC